VVVVALVVRVDNVVEFLSTCIQRILKSYRPTATCYVSAMIPDVGISSHCRMGRNVELKEAFFPGAPMRYRMHSRK